MILESYICTKGDQEVNEDALIINDDANVYGVLDGVTSLTSFKDALGKTGGYLAANLIKNYFEKLDCDSQLVPSLLEANLLLKETMLENGIDPANKEQLWGAAAAIVKLEPSHIHYIQIADCMIFAEYHSGTIRTLTHDQVAHIDEITLQKLKEGLEKGVSGKEQLRAYVREVLITNRYKANSEHGYGVINGEEEAGAFIEYGKVSRANLKRLILLSDGMLMHGSDWQETVRKILEMGLDNYTNHLQQIEDHDSLCETFIRFKKSDDKSGIVIRL